MIPLSRKWQDEITKAILFYREKLNPWVVSVEARYNLFPAEVLNEIRAFVNHVSRCYADGLPDEKIERNIERAHNHLYRAVFDCMKHLIISFVDEMRDFEAETKDIDLWEISDGEFYVEYKRLKKEARKKTEIAKKIEKNDINPNYKEDGFQAFQEAFNVHAEIGELLADNNENIRVVKKRTINRNRRQRFSQVGWNVFWAFLSAILGVLLGYLLFK